VLAKASLQIQTIVELVALSVQGDLAAVLVCVPALLAKDFVLGYVRTCKTMSTTVALAGTNALQELAMLERAVALMDTILVALHVLLAQSPALRVVEVLRTSV
jgi:hypothetical protein